MVSLRSRRLQQKHTKRKLRIAAELLKEAEERGKESAEFDLNKLQEMTYRNAT